MFHQAELDHYLEHGYVIIDGALDSFGLERVQAGYEHIQSLTEPAWRQSVLDGNYKGGYGNGPDAHTMGNIHQYDDLWLDIAANPRILPLLKEIVGINVQTMEMVAHCHHSGTAAHTGWHRDWPAWTHPKYTLKAKVFYFLDDQDEDMGCFSLVWLLITYRI